MPATTRRQDGPTLPSPARGSGDPVVRVHNEKDLVDPMQYPELANPKTVQLWKERCEMHCQKRTSKMLLLVGLCIESRDDLQQEDTNADNSLKRTKLTYIENRLRPLFDRYLTTLNRDGWPYVEDAIKLYEMEVHDYRMMIQNDDLHDRYIVYQNYLIAILKEGKHYSQWSQDLKWTKQWLKPYTGMTRVGNA